MQLVTLLLLPTAAHAACSDPAGNEGDMVYNSSYDVMMFCNGSDQWISMAGAGGSVSWDDLTDVPAGFADGTDDGGGGSSVWLQDGPGGPAEIYYSGGNVGIGVASPSTLLHVNGVVTATAYYHSSDIRLKKDIVPSGGLDVLDAIHGVTYRWKDSDQQASGIVAQDVEKVMPYAVSTNADGMKAVEYDQLIAPMIEAIKTLADENKALKARVEALEAGGKGAAARDM